VGSLLYRTLPAGLIIVFKISEVNIRWKFECQLLCIELEQSKLDFFLLTFNYVLTLTFVLALKNITSL